MGPVAGDAMTVTYGFGNGVCGYFGSSRAREAPGQRFGLHVFGTKGVISLGTGTLPPAWILEDPSWTLFAKQGAWKPLSSAGIGEPEPIADGSLRHGNALAAQDLIRCVRSGARPASSIHDGRASLEMIMAVYESHRLNAPVAFPLTERRHPLTIF
jgi:predicted dehydrogenase